MMPTTRGSGLRAGMAVLCVLGSGATPAFAAADTTARAEPSAEREIYKTATYQGLSSANDFLFGLLFSGGVEAGGVLAAASTVTEPATYYAHERIWDGVQAVGGYDDLDLVPVKTATYTAANMGRIFVIGTVVTGSTSIAAGYVAFNAVADAVSYAVNDVTWHALWPPPSRPPAEDPLEDP